ncbi:integrase core domain-containing protein [Streptomyces sp. VNUA24]|uniref:integrase core domain-containing protein n=1 Tax=Streptomyces sp. VNUA24 TaxID=3031131 RepID=UPI0023B85C30|nr:integrase core domain-containing protein [Streptomyces sp. VNUA24]WEH12818.1 integrase core domain-containing protein [Streptomyces sp. VNUA24]
MAISRQNSRSISRLNDGAPGDFIGDLPVSAFIHPAGLPITPPYLGVLRRPVESAQYGSRAFAGLCDQLGVTRSMGAIGTSADNAACESFHASLKRETLRGAHDYGDADTCRRTVFAWLTRYNTRRRHSANGHLSPNEYEHRHHTAKLTLAA